MQKKIRQHHPCREGCGSWAQLVITSMKSLWRSFSTGAEIPPSSGAGYPWQFWSALRLRQANTSAGICGRGIPAGAVRSEKATSHRRINVNAGGMLNTN